MTSELNEEQIREIVREEIFRFNSFRTELEDILVKTAREQWDLVSKRMIKEKGRI